jgi:predicted secreted protein
MIFFLACYLLLPSLSILLHAQIPDTVWSHTYGGTNTDILYSTCETSDGGFIAAGYTYSFGAGQQDAYLVKTYGNGDAAWTRTFGGSSMDGAHFVREAIDGGYVIAGYTESFGGGGKNVYLIKTDTAGYAEIPKTYATPLMDVAYAFCTTPDNGYMFVGYKNGPSGWAKGDLWILKTDVWLDTAWTKEYGGASEDYGISIQPTPDGGYIIAGSTMSFGAGGKDVWLVKIDANGDTSWTKTYGGVLEDVAYGVNVTADGGYIVSGYINGIGAWTAGDVWLLKTDSLGDTLWTVIYGASGEDYGFDVYQTPDNGYVTAGRGSNDFWLLRTDPQGDTLWTRKYGGAGTESALALSRTSDGGYIIGGYTTSFGSGLQDFWLIRTEPDVGIENGHSSNLLLDRLPATIITGQLNLPTHSEFKVYDISGRIVEPSMMVKGIYFVEVDGTVIHKLVKIK